MASSTWNRPTPSPRRHVTGFGGRERRDRPGLRLELVLAVQEDQKLGIVHLQHHAWEARVGGVISPHRWRRQSLEAALASTTPYHAVSVGPS